MTVIDLREVNKATRHVRRLSKQLEYALVQRDVSAAYRHAEGMQHAAFEAKRILVSGGKYEPETEPEPER